MNTHTTINEKEPLLPEPINQRPKQHCFKNWLKTHTPRLILTGLWLYLFIAYIYNPQQQAQQPDNDVVSDIETYNQQQFSLFENTQAVCYFDPGFAYDGVSEFEFDPATFPNLLVEENQRGGHKGRSIQIASGQTEVTINESLDVVKVTFDIIVSHESLLDSVWVEDVQDEESGLYMLKVHEDDDVYESKGCIKISAKIEVPSFDALKSLTIALANNAIEFQEGLSFDHLKVSVANGHIEFGAISVGDTRLSVANGHITGTISTLNGDLSASAANGHNELKIKEVKTPEEQEGTKITLSVANGHNDLEVPVSFESRYHLSNVVGRRIVESSLPSKLHRKSAGWRTLDGYFGDDANTKNTISLSSANGGLHLNYV